MILRLVLPVLLVSLVACGGSEGSPAEDRDTGGDATADAGDLPRDVEPDATPDAPDAPDATPDAPDNADVVDTGPACEFEPGEPENIPVPAIHTPRWAFEPWISKDISDGPDTYAFVDGFMERDIPVGVVVLDSPWETHYNTFIPNPDRYPDFEQMVADLRARGVRVVLWITQMINSIGVDGEAGGDSYVGPSANLAQAEACDFLVDDGRQYFWWKGYGAGLDFFNPDAVAWWHAQQDLVLDAGIAGWKLDFGEEYVTSDPVMTAAGPRPHQEYSEAYYRDFLSYGVHKAGADEFVTMVRPYDKSYQWEGRFFARPEHAPVGWVGDNTRDWAGLSDALDHIFRSADAGYVVIGSDIGGYLDRLDTNLTVSVPYNQGAFDKWVALGAMMPFMQLHGRANLAPWTVPDDVDEFIALYRYWSKLHSALVPFFYSLAQEAYAGNAPPIVRPVGTLETWAGDYRFSVGDAFFVAPILDETGTRDVELPPGVRYYDWWNPGGDAIEGGQTLEAYDASARDRIPLFVKQGAIIPMRDAGAAALWLYPSASPTEFVVHDEDGMTTRVGLGAAQVDLSRVFEDVLLQVRWEAPPVSVGDLRAVEDAAVAEEGWSYDASARRLSVKVRARNEPISLAVE